ncbi:MAG: hypothetical protein COU68_04170, partial [Candidatus Pacebacteria bacterium CG10_big_fil_rev_8_21_14_0_10_45_6]
MDNNNKKPIKKLLFLITKSNWYGAQKYVYNLAEACRDNYDVAVAFGGGGVLGNEAPGLLKTKLEEAGIRAIFIPELVRDVYHFRELQSAWALYKLFKRERPDILHLNSSKAGGEGAFAGRLAGVPRIVFTSHGLATDEDRNIFSKLLIWLSTWVTFLLSHKIIVISQDTYTRARKFPFCKNKISLVYNSIQPIAFLSRTEARHKLGLESSNDIPVIGSIGELIFNKRYDTLISALALLKGDGKKFQAVLICAGEDKEKLEKQARDAGLSKELIFAGYVPHAAEYLHALDIFVLPSKKEGLPYVLLEAGSAELAVVASRIPGNTDIITNEETGLLFKVADAEGLAKQLERLLGNNVLRKKLGLALKEQIKSKF